MSTTPYLDSESTLDKEWKTPIGHQKTTARITQKEQPRWVGWMSNQSNFEILKNKLKKDENESYRSRAQTLKRLTVSIPEYKPPDLKLQ